MSNVRAFGQALFGKYGRLARALYVLKDIPERGDKVVLAAGVQIGQRFCDIPP
jgi:hypothetical protein